MRAVERTGGELPRRAYRVDGCRADVVHRTIVPVDGVVEGLSRIQRQVLKAGIGYLAEIGDREQSAFRNLPVLNHQERGVHVGDGHLERGRGRASVVVLHVNGHRVEAVVRETMRAVERTGGELSRRAYRVDGCRTDVAHRAIAPVDGVVEGLSCIQRQVLKTGIGYLTEISDREQPAFRNRLVLDHGERGVHVGDGHLEGGCGRAAVVVHHTHRHRVEAVVREEMRAVERAGSRCSRRALRVDGHFAVVARRTVAPVDGVVEGLLRAQHTVIEPRTSHLAQIGNFQQSPFHNLHVLNHGKRWRHVGDGHLERGRGRATVVVHYVDGHCVEAVVRESMRAVERSGGKSSGRAYRVDGCRADVVQRTVAPVDGVVKGLLRAQRQVLETGIGYLAQIGNLQESAFGDLPVLNHRERGGHVGDGYLERSGGRSAVVVHHVYGHCVEAVVRETMRAVERTGGKFSGRAYRVDGCRADVVQRTVAPVDGVVKGLLRAQRQVLETGIGYLAQIGNLQESAFGDLPVPNHPEPGVHVGDGNLERGRGRAAVVVLDTHLDSVDTVVREMMRTVE